MEILCYVGILLAVQIVTVFLLHRQQATISIIFLSPITNNNTSTSLSPVSPISTKSKKRKRIDLDDYEEALFNSLTQKTEANPIDRFMLRLAEGLHRLSYKSRLKLEIEFKTI